MDHIVYLSPRAGTHSACSLEVEVCEKLRESAWMCGMARGGSDFIFDFPNGEEYGKKEALRKLKSDQAVFKYIEREGLV